MQPEELTGARTTGLDFGAVFEALQTPYVVLSPALVVVGANTAYLERTGRSRQDVLGVDLFEAFPPTADSLDDTGVSRIQASLERVRDSGEAEAMPLQRYDIRDAATGELAERYWVLSAVPVLDDHGRTLVIVQRAEDVTDFVVEREAGRLAAEAGAEWRRRTEVAEAELFVRARELSAALEAKDAAAARLARQNEVAMALTTARTVEDLERIVVGNGVAVLGADGGALVTATEDEQWRVTVNASLGQHVQTTYGLLPRTSPLPACWTARTGQRLLLPTRASGLAFDAAMAQVYDDTRRDGWAFLPLVVGEEVLGALAVSWREEHPFRRDELELLDGFAAQCAQALHRIRGEAARREAAESAQQLSEALQRSMLTHPPSPPSLSLAVRYQPAAREARVGGDWYDAFVTADGDTLLVVGDVAGHDREAAAVMGQVRNLLRGIAYASTDGPAALLARLDAALQGLDLDALATAVLVRVEGGGAEGVRRTRWSSAGHPPPVLRRADGSTAALETESDLLLGLDPLLPRVDHDVLLHPGDALLLYTDGLVERRTADLDHGIARLVELVTAEGALAPEQLCDALLEHLDDDLNDDDIALLVLRLEPDAGVVA